MSACLSGCASTLACLSQDQTQSLILAQHEHADVHEAGLVAHQALDVGVACTGSGDGSSAAPC